MAGSITRYVYDGEDLLLEYDGTNTFRARYSHGDQVDQPLVLQKAGLGFFYYHRNHQGSITHLTNSAGAVVNRYTYDAYGRCLSVTEAVGQPYSYTGREYDTESGVYYYRARSYDPTTGRFLSEDPIGFNGKDQNLYRYVLNNPGNFVDPTGKQVTVGILPNITTIQPLPSSRPSSCPIDPLGFPPPFERKNKGLAQKIEIFYAVVCTESIANSGLLRSIGCSNIV